MKGDVLLSINPWVGGTRAKGYWGPIKIERMVSGPSWEEAIDAILEDAADEARVRCCNAVVGMEITCDPYRPNGGHIRFEGTAADLEPLFAGVSVWP